MDILNELDLEENNPLIDPPKKEKKEVILSDEQKLIILKAWDEHIESPLSVPDFISLCWPNLPEEQIDARNVYGRLIKDFLTSKFGINIVTPPKTKKEVELTETQKEYIKNNYSSMRPFDMAKEVFQNASLSPVSIEAKSVYNYVKSIPSYLALKSDDDNAPEFDYRPPKQISHVLKRIRTYISTANNWDEKKLTPMQKKCCEALINYLHDFRFKRQIDSFDNQEDKITFECEFVKYTYNKNELEQEEISQYIVYCSLVVTEFNIKKQIEMLQSQMNAEYEEHQRVAKNTVDALTSARDELNNCIMKQKSLLEALTEKRSDKLSKELKDKESLLNLFNTWKNYESRQQLLKIRQRDKENLRKEIHEIEEMSELKQRVLGLSCEEIING